MKRAFTLIELLVILAIIAILFGLLFPAIQKIRESASRLKCQNNLKQQGLACLNYEATYSVLPDGGHRDRPGLFWQILPYVEEANRAEVILQRSPKGDFFSSDAYILYTCPSRPVRFKESWFGKYFCGDYGWANSPKQPIQWPIQIASDWCGGVWTSDGTTPINFSGWPNQVYGYMLLPDPRCGSTYRPAVRIAEITDGTSNTLLLGEKGLGTQYYSGNNQDTPVYGVAAYGIALNTFVPPIPDSRGNPWCEHFGSAHISGINTVFCDGSVKVIPFEIQQSIWKAYNTKSGND